MSMRLKRGGTTYGGHTAEQIARRKANVDQVRKLLAKRPMTVAELATAVGVPGPTMNGYLRQLEDMGEACSMRADGQRGNTWIADARSAEEAAERAQVEHARRARIAKARQEGMQRDPLVAALFGPARAAA